MQGTLPSRVEECQAPEQGAHVQHALRQRGENAHPKGLWAGTRRHWAGNSDPSLSSGLGSTEALRRSLLGLERWRASEDLSLEKHLLPNPRPQGPRWKGPRPVHAAAAVGQPARASVSHAQGTPRRRTALTQARRTSLQPRSGLVSSICSANGWDLLLCRTVTAG